MVLCGTVWLIWAHFSYLNDTPERESTVGMLASIGYAIGGIVGAGIGKLVYQIAARTALGPTITIPMLRSNLTIRDSMAPFDGVAREHIRRWRASPYAS
jgi:hypothetical protein